MITPQPDAPVLSPGNEAVADWQEVRRIGHDLNNLLGAVVGYAEMLVEDTPPDAPNAPDLRRIYEAAQRASGLVATLMAHARQAQAARDGRPPRG
ncbi:MAG: histidine kinase dimerization/phospho-acceptor domain-containing protein [Vicinamibacterales bacterium]|nr:histidine kinase dimerization/phospho-acceptor domain-containing protein [Vicinamibacterales bacterium]